MISNPYRFFLDERDQWSDDPFVSSDSIFDVWPLMIDVISVLGYKTLIDLPFVLHNHQIRCSGRFSLFALRLLLSKAKSWLYPSQHLSPSQIGACGTFYSVGLFTFLMNLSLGCHNLSTSFFAYLPTTQKKNRRSFFAKLSYICSNDWDPHYWISCHVFTVPQISSPNVKDQLA